MHNLVNVLNNRAKRTPSKNAILFLEDGLQETAFLSYKALDQRAKAIAASLQAHQLQGSRVLLLYPAGTEFIEGLIGCWYAGVIAVPLNCPKVGEFELHREVINSIANDAQIAAVLTVDVYCSDIENVIEHQVAVLATDKLNSKAAKDFRSIAITEDTIAYLQYTSGSTSAPKAAIITHGNLKHSLKETINAWHYTKNSVTLTWAPHTHVYGMVCGILVPLYHGSLAIIMPPKAFINNPIVWLSAISKYRVSHSGCPNFGYDICVDRINDEGLASINLKHWKVAINGGDIVQHQTLSAFATKFSSCGFALSTFCSAYGMSELAGAIAVTSVGFEPKLSKHSENVSRPIISSGSLLEGLHAVVVDPQTELPVAEGETGEVWLSGKSLVSGYWQKPDENKEVFNKQVPGSELTYFRTGDLGFVLEGELYLTGRLKEVIIVYGKKYYPLDLELTIAKSLAEFEIDLPQVVFSTEIAGKEEVIVVQELSDEHHTASFSQIRDAIRHDLTKQHGIEIHRVLFVGAGGIPKTLSGKLQRKKCQLLFIENQLPVLALHAPQERAVNHYAAKGAADLFISIIAEVLKTEARHIDLNAPLSRYAFNSINIITLTAKLNETFQLALSPAALYEYATLHEFYTDLLDKNAIKSMSHESNTLIEQSTDIAIIGMSGMFPKASDVTTFWDNLCKGVDCISEVPSSRWDWHDLTLQWGGFIEGIDQFDAAFFNISPREAELIDPQQRLFLQTVWKTIEDAGYTATNLALLKTGLFVGVFNHDYAELLQENEVVDAYLTTSTVHSMIANRISYLLNLRGPSEAIDTACSSSLVAIHHAVRAILQGDCELAIAGGVNSLITPTAFIAADKAGMLSEDGRCKTFDKQANGYVRGEGVGALLLKKLSQALLDNDPIYGVIKGTAINHGGHVNTLTAPNPNAQAEVVVTACQRANIPVTSLQYIEAHGTGTPLGDPIEINGLKKAFQELAVEQGIELPHHYCGLGSVKTHIGHLESAAGIASIIKILLAMRHNKIPANLHLNELNPYIDIQKSPFYIMDTETEWPRKQSMPRRAGVSSFGLGGANAHIILEESPARTSTSLNHADYLIALSATTSSALLQRIIDLRTWLNNQVDLPCLSSLSYTLNAGREHFNKRYCVIVKTLNELQELLNPIASIDDIISLKPAYDSDLNQLQEDYLQGQAIDWQALYGDYQEKISLPTYPFAKDSHWIKVKDQTARKLHALIDEKSSNTTSVMFSKFFSGEEFYLKEHQVNNEPVLPGALCLELVQVAAGIHSPAHTVKVLKNIVWKRAIKSADILKPLQVVFPNSTEDSFVLRDDSGLIEYMTGALDYANTNASERPASNHIPALKSVLARKQSPEEFYSYFNNVGISYGPSFQVIQSIHHDASYLLAELALSPAMAAKNDDFIIHPCLLDGVLQSTQVLLNNRETLYLPYAIKQVTVYDTLPTRCYVQAHLVSEKGALHVFNIQVMDREGKVLLTLMEFTLGPVAPKPLSANDAHSIAAVHPITTSALSSEVGLDLYEKTEFFLKTLLAKSIKCAPEGIDSQLTFEHYGIDSIMVLELNQDLEEQFKDLPKTLFFEYQTTAALTQYFIDNHASELQQLLADSIDDIQPEDSSSLPVEPNLTTEHAATPMHWFDTAPQSEIQEIAIIGVHGRYPAAQDLSEFWDNLKAGRDCITEVPQERWNLDEYFDLNKDLPGKTYSKWGGFLTDIDKFDPLFFNISPREAVLMDPQERLFLETAWKTIEDAGYARERLAGKKVGVYVGVMYGQYQLFANESPHSEQFVPTNSVYASIANRVSYFFDFHGPSIALDTMCSSSLTAIHLACKSIQDGECQLALAGGVNLSVHPNKYVLLSHGKFLASDGHCRSFGDGGDGYVPGEGVGAVLLKPLQAAIADGDLIYAVIKGSQLNHGGKTNGYTVPNPNAQAELIAEAYQRANTPISLVSYVEAHGTGTSLGDPIEIAGLNKAFNQESQKGHCAIGSVKSNIGHCESAAGIAAVTKVLLQLQHKTLAPSLFSEQLNSNINWEKTPFKVQQTLSEWIAPQITNQGMLEQAPRIAGISSFGAGGSNAHLILSEAPELLSYPSTTKSHYLVTLSGKTEQALKTRAMDLLHWLDKNPSINLEQMSYTLNAGRSHFDCRCAMVISSIDEARYLLQCVDSSVQPEHLLMQFNQSKPAVVDVASMQTLVQQLAHTHDYQNTLLALAAFYVQGHELDWEEIHRNESKKKISLPTYPFAKERYWYSDAQSSQGLSFASRGQTAGYSETLIQSVDMALEPEVVQEDLSVKVMPVLMKLAGQILKITQHQINSEKSLGDYGMDSIHFIELAKKIAEHYQIEFTPEIFYNHNSVLAISHYIISEFPEAVARVHHTVAARPITPSSSPALQPTIIAQGATQDIAIIGMQGLLPQSKDLAEFWQHLLEGHDLVTEVPAERWNWSEYYGDIKTKADKSNSKWGAFINDVDQFDAGFFNISAREANLMDPQQRLFLEMVWKTIEDAGYNPFELSSQKVGVFAGVEFNEYHTLIAKQQQEFHGFIATGNSHSMLANRVSYFFNFQGPSEAIDTACSSSMVALHRAVQAIRYGECNLAIAGGVSLILNPDTYVITSQLGALSAEGRCKTFDASANGYVKGEGVGAFLLKPLKQAQLDGDAIYAVIKASAVNHGGKAQSLTAPNTAAQSDLLVNAYTQAGINPETITYIETHGTGTALGDPVEIDGLKSAFNILAPGFKENKIGLGSIKTTIGHLEPASGMAGIMKLVLSMMHETIPGILHFKQLNPYINLTDTPFYIVEHKQVWERLKDAAGQDIPLRAGVSSFGFGGTNAHVVIEEGRLHQRTSSHYPRKPYYLIALSAKQQDSLQQKITDLLLWLTQNKETVSLASLSFTLTKGRAHFLYRTALVVSSIDELLSVLNLLQQDEIPEYCILNEGQTCSMQSPVFDEVYQGALQALKNPGDSQQYRHRLFILADLYTKHYSIDWQQLFLDEEVHRIHSLPAYPFVKQRYWYDLEFNAVATPTALVPATAPSGTIDFSTAVSTYLRQIFAEQLRTSPDAIQLDETYEAYGVDSLITLDITTRLEKDFGVLPKTLLYERNKLNDLANYFLKHHKEQLATILAIDTALPVANIVADSLEPAKALSTSLESSGDIAIIGLSGTFPMAKTMDEFWHNLTTGRDCVGEVPSDRWNYLDYPVQVGSQERYFPHGGFIPDVDKFDPLFFNISPRDAGLMDPQERLFMQSAWSTLEDAGYTREKLKRQAKNSVGVFAGVTYNFYPVFIAEEWQKGNRVPLDVQSFSVANRLSYFLDLNGPSFVVDTACSSSLAAIHLACDSISRGDCAMAIAGGVNLSLHPSKYHFLGSFSFMSEQGRCTSFAEGGTGYVPSEGVGTVLLKPLADAIADNDLIYGVIKGSSMNHGGKTSGYTVPNPNAQTEVIQQALNKAKVDPRTISYIEAHGTGTALGDPIEIRGLQEAFETFTQDKQYCAIGSVKSNIGHLESAAGISQLAKVILQMRHKKLVPTLHTEQLNSYIDFNNSPFYVQRELSDWQHDATLNRRAGISSFGAGGTNVHMIIEEYVSPIKPKDEITGPYVFLLSALNQERLDAQVQQMRTYFQDNTPVDNQWLRDACYTLQVGRESMPARLAIIATTKEQLLEALSHYPQTDFPNLWINYQVQNRFAPIADLSHLVGDKNLKGLVDHWMNGSVVDWQLMYQNQRPSIVSLPTYSFAKRRCWIPTVEIEPTLVSQSVVEAEEEFDRSEWLYKTQWEKSALPISSELKNTKGKWLILSDAELGLVLQQDIDPADCIYCFQGEQYNQFNNHTYYINPEQKDSYTQLLRDVYAEHGEHLKGIIYLSSAVNSSEKLSCDPSLSLLYLFKALLEHTWTNQLTVALVTQNAQPVHAQETIDIWQHHLWSMTRIFAAEQANYQVLLLDLDASESLRQNASIIANELRHQQAQQNHIAYRASERYTVKFVPNAVPSVQTNAQPSKTPEAVLITGGLGALGYEVAEFLVTQGARFLLLTGTTELSSQTQEKNSWLNQLKAYGVQVHYAAVNVADKEAMRQLIQETETAWNHKIKGVYHLAGVTTDNVPIAEMEESLWREVLDVKIKGALNLHELFLQAELSCFVLFSSIAAVPHFGMAGLSAYAVANEFINGLALYRRSLQLPAQSINWVAWSEKGMSHRHNHDAFLGAVGMTSLSIKKGIMLLKNILSLDATEITVCHIDWKKFLQVNAAAKHNDFFTHFVTQYSLAAQNALISSLNKEEISVLVLQLFAKTLELDRAEVEHNTPFQQYGMDSIRGINFTGELGVHFPDVVSPMDLYKYPTLKELIAYIVQQVQRSSESMVDSSLDIEKIIDMDQLTAEQLNDLLESELKELELTYD